MADENELELTPQERALVHAAISAGDDEAAKRLLLDAARRAVESDPLTIIYEIDGYRLYGSYTAPSLPSLPKECE